MVRAQVRYEKTPTLGLGKQTGLRRELEIVKGVKNTGDTRTSAIVRLVWLMSILLDVSFPPGRDVLFPGSLVSHSDISLSICRSD